MRRLHADFDRTFKALEAGLHVEHIAEFDLKTCRPKNLAASYLEDRKLASYDNFPVRNRHGIIGVLERQRVGTCVPKGMLVEEVMVPLSSAMLAANNQPVAALLDALRSTRYRLVFKGCEIAGIVTPSDLLKLPVRLYAFMLVTHLEMLMAATIRRSYRDRPAEAWISTLSTGRQCWIRDKVEAFSARKLDPDPIELTDFCDKRDILRRFHGAADQFRNEMVEIENLRNSLAHAANYLNNEDSLDIFLKRVDLTRRNIEYLHQRLGPHQF